MYCVHLVAVRAFSFCVSRMLNMHVNFHRIILCKDTWFPKSLCSVKVRMEINCTSDFKTSVVVTLNSRGVIVGEKCNGIYCSVTADILTN